MVSLRLAVFHTGVPTSPQFSFSTVNMQQVSLPRTVISIPLTHSVCFLPLLFQRDLERATRIDLGIQELLRLLICDLGPRM